MSTIALSVVLITHNEAGNIASCLKSVAFADEWIVVDSGSTDATCEIARDLGATVVVTSDWPGFIRPSPTRPQSPSTPTTANSP